ncbi:beta-ketoacyl synthase chain length factor [Azospirillum rugosum]|uniref:Beta-ketoacyl synthase-like N-terminal domain-containing protein n=1 Tax=Azospirillum rugosum TaxID=416170 RepID=A0ABS4SIK8_9PROT|nr:beta-ketoacyl synthase chain length factor [Azospirillum rugosum]MBP2292054.1 hypothetical protein [Azospirillum rugosum]MDQ0525810.1 hypothetical protein [Azospirillum rugosum]
MMTPGLRFSVRDWWAWAPAREGRAAWRVWAGGQPVEAAADAAAPSLPMMLRRRTTAFGQKMIAGALACGDYAATARCVLASRHGELSRTLGILRAQCAGEPPSPAEFSMSVHHGLVGLLSIHTGNRAGHTALAAGPDSFGFGLIEALAGLAERPDEPVLLLYGDEPLPEPYDQFREDGDAEQPLVVALALGPVAAGEGALVMSAEPAANADGPAREPAELAFLRFLLSGAASATAEGGRMRWEWRRDG